MTGVVLRHEGGAVVVDVGGEEVRCAVRKSLRRDGAKGVAVGDRVTVESSGGGLAIASVGERRGMVARPDPSNPRREQVIVANVDLALVVAAVARPELTPGLIDRFLVALDARGIEAVIVATKTDLGVDAEEARLLEVYRAIGYRLLPVSVVDGSGVEALRELLRGRTTVMLGHSGVGKSSLANALHPSLALRVGAVDESTGLGVHTTTTVSLLRLPWGGYLVDTPGIREFGLVRVPPSDLRHHFRDLAAVGGRCRFNDCLHRREPGCAVKEAVASGAIAAWRHDSYLRLLAELETTESERFL